MEIAKLFFILLLWSFSTAQETNGTNSGSCDPATQTGCADAIGDDAMLPNTSPLEDTGLREEDSTEARGRLAERLEDFTNLLEDVHNVVSHPGDAGCPPITHACVPYYQCINGEINTDGSNIIDIRTRPISDCTDPDNPLVPGICCKFPETIIVPTPVTNCPNGLVCVETEQCDQDGTVITDGSGIIGIRRVQKASEACYLEPHSSKIGVCCALKIEPPLRECPNYEVCVPGELCTTRSHDDKVCFLDEPNYITGVCCDVRVITHCPRGSECIPEHECRSAILDNTDNYVEVGASGIWARCELHGRQDIGVCCRYQVLQFCPSDSECIPANDCVGEIFDSTNNNYVDVGASGFWSRCNLYDSQDIGVCCRYPILHSCPLDSRCIPANECEGEILDSTNNYVDVGASGIWSRCNLYGSQDTGVCCRYPVLQSCPPDSECIPEYECEGEILDNSRKFVAIEANGIWSRCNLKGSHDSGVCCLQKDSEYPVAKECGIRNYNLKGRAKLTLAKNVASFGEFPWQAIIFFRNYTYKCGASLIGDKWLITGAHCVNGYSYGDFRVRLGEWQVNSEQEPLPSIDVDIASIHLHPGFNSRNLYNNIALIELAAPVEFEYHINTICLPSHGRVVLPGTRCVGTGWGKDAFKGSFQPILHNVDVPFVEHSYCQALLRKTRLGRFFNLHRSFSCYGGEENKDVCTGDGGGPLACKDPVTGQYFLLGITSWGIGCGDKDVPGVYADVSFFDHWIKDQLKL